MDLNLVAPCGIDCGNCELFRANGRRDVWERAAEKRGLKAEDMACDGCRDGGGCSFLKGVAGSGRAAADCETRTCVLSKGLDFCGDCGNFPCRRLQPLAEGAGFYPHNMKVYNLGRIRAVGPEAFLAEGKEIRRLYFTGKFKVGAGPQDPAVPQDPAGQ